MWEVLWFRWAGLVGYHWCHSSSRASVFQTYNTSAHVRGCPMQPAWCYHIPPWPRCWVFCVPQTMIRFSSSWVKLDRRALVRNRSILDGTVGHLQEGCPFRFLLAKSMLRSYSIFSSSSDSDKPVWPGLWTRTLCWVLFSFWRRDYCEKSLRFGILRQSCPWFQERRVCISENVSSLRTYTMEDWR